MEIFLVYQTRFMSFNKWQHGHCQSSYWNENLKYTMTKVLHNIGFTYTLNVVNIIPKRNIILVKGHKPVQSNAKAIVKGVSSIITFVLECSGCSIVVSLWNELNYFMRHNNTCIVIIINIIRQLLLCFYEYYCF